MGSAVAVGAGADTADRQGSPSAGVWHIPSTSPSCIPLTNPSSILHHSALPEDLLVRVREELTCCLCLDLAARPATLPCGHSACRGCLTELFNMGRPDAERRCPACRAQFSAGTQPLQLNATLKCLAELLLPGG